MAHNIILVRHGENLDAEHGVVDSGLSERGIAQARALAARLAPAGVTQAWHSPLDRAWETMNIIHEALPMVPTEPSALLMDCVPSDQSPETPAVFAPFFGSVSEAEVEAGSAQMSDAVAEFLSPGRQGHTDLLVTHNAVIGWFVREVLEAPDWRWVAINQSNCGITVIQQRPGRPWTLISHNDVGHLPTELHTGFPGAALV